MPTAKATPLNFSELLSQRFVEALPYLAAFAGIGTPAIAGMRFSGILWLLSLLTAFVLLLSLNRSIRFPWYIWAPWFVWCGVSLLWSSKNIRLNMLPLFQIASPFLVGLVASQIIRKRSQLSSLLRGYKHSIVLIALIMLPFLLTSRAGDGVDSSFYYMVRTAMIGICLTGAVFLSQFHTNRRLAVWGWLACVALTFITGSRSATLVLVALWFALPLRGRMGTKLLAATVLILTAIAAFYTPMVQERFFHSGHGTLSDIAEGDFDTSGRGEAWPLIFEKAMELPLKGRGIGESAAFVPEVWQGIDKPHNDFLRIFFETGIVGVFLFTAAMIIQIVLLWRMTRRSDESNWPATAALLGFVAFALLAATDNPIIYAVWFVHPLFGLTGAAYGYAYATAHISTTSTSAIKAIPSNSIQRDSFWQRRFAR